MARNNVKINISFHISLIHFIQRLYNISITSEIFQENDLQT